MSIYLLQSSSLKSTERKTWTYILSKDELVHVASEHGAGREDTGVCWRHDSGRHCAEAHKGHPGRSQELQNHGENHARLRRGQRVGALVVCLVPCWNRRDFRDLQYTRVIMKRANLGIDSLKKALKLRHSQGWFYREKANWIIGVK